jgi:creatinine amidohydrolase
MTTQERVRRPIDNGDWNMAFLFPAEVAEARERTGLAILPIAPLEWHGPHLAMGCDNLLAHAFARRLAEELKSPYYPPLFIGTERERAPQMLESIGFSRDAFVEGMDFPKNTVASAYYREEVFAAVVRDSLNILLGRMKFKKVLIVNGHGADNQKATLNRMCTEFNGGGPKRVMWVYPGFPTSPVAGSIGHAAAHETAMLMVTWPACVDVSRLPKAGKLKNVDFAIVDGETFDNQPTPDKTLREEQDPRTKADVKWAREYIDEAVRQVVADVRKWIQ